MNYRLLEQIIQHTYSKLFELNRQLTQDLLKFPICIRSFSHNIWRKKVSMRFLSHIVIFLVKCNCSFSSYYFAYIFINQFGSFFNKTIDVKYDSIRSCWLGSLHYHIPLDRIKKKKNVEDSKRTGLYNIISDFMINSFKISRTLTSSFIRCNCYKSTIKRKKGPLKKSIISN